MDKDYWFQKWESQDIGFNQAQPNKLMQTYFSRLNLPPGSRVFVPLCGQSIDMLWLIAAGYEVIGVELSQIACRRFFEAHKIPNTVAEIKNFSVYSSDKITIFCGDFFKLNQALLGKIDVIYDRAALIALPIDTRKRYAQHLLELATPTTSMFLITMEYNQAEMPGPPFSVNEREINELYHPHFAISLLARTQFVAPSHLQLKGLTQACEQVYCLKIS